MRLYLDSCVLIYALDGAEPALSLCGATPCSSWRATAILIG